MQQKAGFVRFDVFTSFTDNFIDEDQYLRDVTSQDMPRQDNIP